MKKKGIFTGCFIVLALLLSDAAYSGRLPKTGQTTQYRAEDDGALQKGVANPSPRFTDNGNGTVTDNLTGLMWIKNPDATVRTWNDAVDYCSNLTTAGGHTDWHLPNLRELQSLIDYQNFNTALPTGHPFIGVQPIYYWSPTTHAGSTAAAWYVRMNDGFADFGVKTGAMGVWPVRGGQ